MKRTLELPPSSPCVYLDLSTEILVGPHCCNLGKFHCAHFLASMTEVTLSSPTCYAGQRSPHAQLNSKADL